MSRNKRRLCGALALLILLGGALAEPVPEATPAPEAPTETVEPTVTVEPTAAIEPTVSAEPTAAPEPKETPEPTETIDPTASLEPTATIEPSASVEPTETIEPTATFEPTVTPEPTAPASAIDLKPEGDAQLIDQIWQIALSDPDAQLIFTWAEIPGAERVHVQISDPDENVLLSQDVAENRIELAPADYPEGPYTLHIEAWAGEELLLQEETQFVLAQGRPGGSTGGMPSGASGSRGGSSGGNSPEGAAEQGFRVTPGEALTSSHASGNGDMQLYGTVALEASDAEMTRLTLGEAELNLTLDGGEAAFTAILNGSTLRLEPVADGARWELTLSALQTLNRSGIESLSLAAEDAEIELSTALELCGGIYGALRAQGLVAKDFTLEISANQQIVRVNGAQYLLTDGGELATN